MTSAEIGTKIEHLIDTMRCPTSEKIAAELDISVTVAAMWMLAILTKRRRENE